MLHHTTPQPLCMHATQNAALFTQNTARFTQLLMTNIQSLTYPFFSPQIIITKHHADLFTPTDCLYFLRIWTLNYAQQTDKENPTEIGHLQLKGF